MLNTSSNDISVYDARELKWLKNLSGGNGPWSLALSPDGQQILVTNMKSTFAPLRHPFFSEVSAVDAESGRVDER